MGIYGDQLCFFPELFRKFIYFSMEPDSVASYHGRKTISEPSGVLQYLKRSELTRENETLADVSVPTFWTRWSLNLGDYFIQDGVDIYRVRDSSSRLSEGGFNCYVLEAVVGNTDQQKPFEYVNLGQDSYE